MRNIIRTCTLILAGGCLLAWAMMNDALHPGNGRHYSNRVAVLEYHHLDPAASEYTITPEMFQAHLLALQANHYQIISMQQFLAFMNGAGTVPPDAVLLTFDDGYESFYEYAYPILRKHGWTAANFLIIGDLETDTGISFLSWPQIREMHSQGFSFYSHTYRAHDFAPDGTGRLVDPLTDPIFRPDLGRTETNEEYLNRVRDDLDQANRILEAKLGEQNKLFCLPHGRYNQALLDISREAGNQAIFSGVDGLNTAGTTFVKRINAGSAKVTPEKLLDKLQDETTVLGKLKITLKNAVNHYRMM